MHKTLSTCFLDRKTIRDPPYYLCEDFVFIHRDDCAEGEGVDGIHHDGVRGTVSLKIQLFIGLYQIFE